jgi:hypothetical protein
VVATADPATLPDKATWYLATSLPLPWACWHPPHASADSGLARPVAAVVQDVAADTGRTAPGQTGP